MECSYIRRTTITKDTFFRVTALLYKYQRAWRPLVDARFSDIFDNEVVYLLPGHALQQVHWQFVDTDTDLRHVVALTYCHRSIVQSLEIDGDAVGRANLILTAITAANIRHVVILRNHQPLQILINIPGSGHQFFFILLQGQHRHFDRRDNRVQAQHSARLFPRRVWLFLIRVEQQVQEGAVYAARSLNNPGYIAFSGILIGIAQILVAILAVTREVPILPPVDTLPLLPAEDGLIFDVEGLFGIVSQFIWTMLAKMQAVLVVDQPLVPLETLLLPVVK